MRVLRMGALVVCAGAAGCAARGASSPPPSSGASTYRASQPAPASAAREQTGAGVAGDDSESAPSVTVDMPATTQSVGGYATTPAPVMPSTPSVAPRQPVDESPRDEDLRRRGEQVARLERWVRAEAQRLTDTREQCRDVCMAAGNICTAAQEICRLTGDPSDARCARAQTACAEAGVTRDSRCPVCPSAR